MTAGVLAALLATGFGGRAEAPTIGQKVQEFSAVAVDGTRLSLDEATNTHRVVVVVFLSTVCPYARYFGDHLGELAERYRSEGALFVVVNSNQFETAEEMVEFAAAHGHMFPLIRDASASIADLLGASCSPEAYVLDQQGRLRYHGWVQSKLRSPDLERALDAVLHGRQVRLARTKAFGCAIDRPRAARASR